MSTVKQEIEDLVSPFWWQKEPPEDDTDVLCKAGLSGLDAAHFMDLFAEKFGVDMNSYRWYFHHDEEGASIGALLFFSALSASCAHPHHSAYPD